MKRMSLVQGLVSQVLSRGVVEQQNDQQRKSAADPYAMGCSVPREPHEHHDGCKHSDPDPRAAPRAAAPPQQGTNRHHKRKLASLTKQVNKQIEKVNKERYKKALQRAQNRASEVMATTNPYENPEAVAAAEELLGK